MNSHKTMKQTAKKSVSFSPMSRVAHIDRPTRDEKKDIWYSRQDKEIFKHIFSYDISHCSQMLMAKAAAGEPLSEEEMIECVGLESVISRNIAERVMKMKRMHVDMILSEQKLQKNFRVHDEVKLARTSDKSSQESRTRSYKIAVRLMGLSNF